MRKTRLLLCALLFLCWQFANAQLGGSRAFEYLNLPNNARIAALGGYNITSGWYDPSQITSNPAILNDTMQHQLVISRLGYFADISNTSLTYVTPIKKYGTWAFHLDYLNYGDIQSFDEAGFLNGDFSVNEYAFSVTNSQEFGPFRVGANLKIAVSDLASFQASALLLDIGGTFLHPERDLTVGFVIKNIGFLISDYTEENQSQLPTDIQLGISYKPEFMPFRFSVTARNLVRSDVTFFDPSTNALFGQSEEPGFGEEIFRRLVFGAELIASPNFQLRFGYNHLLRQELKLGNASGGAGFSFGFMFKVKRFEFAYSRALYHTAGGSNTLQMNLNLNGIINKN
ncbi:type IX secretion system protein PorQ [Roseivirga sp. E12]|uniref:type IX secretion system protein PorQ n=1 Tax=Roseivirga sp. E12 TaxID=2819237 RepID=UPI001ABC6524|nr:type IX secretion system protein PorQ [Roseivirga sp. E12]MBO3699035.1 type IX secretion system protein PorQ [Roseivirga sp. E12]